MWDCDSLSKFSFHDAHNDEDVSGGLSLATLTDASKQFCVLTCFMAEEEEELGLSNFSNKFLVTTLSTLRLIALKCIITDERIVIKYTMCLRNYVLHGFLILTYKNAVINIESNIINIYKFSVLKYRKVNFGLQLSCRIFLLKKNVVPIFRSTLPVLVEIHSKVEG